MSSPNIVAIHQIDLDSVAAFFEGLPAGDRTFFGEAFDGRATLESWRNDDHAQRFVMVAEDQVVGYVAVVHGVAWSAHVAQLRLVVAPAQRGHGLGRRLARHGVQTALEGGSRKLIVEVVADQVATIALFTGMGFVPEALLEDHVRDDRGRVMDLIVLALRGPESLALLDAAGANGDLA